MSNSTAQVLAIQGVSRAMISKNVVHADTPMHSILSHLIDATAGDPNFPPTQEPLADGRAFRAHDGTAFYRVEARVATREGQFGGPDVRFLKDFDGTVRLHIELEQHFPAGVAATAQPLGKVTGTPRIRWTDGEISLNQPTVFRDENSGAWRMRFLKVLSASEVGDLFAAMTDPDADASLLIDFSYRYTISDQPEKDPKQKDFGDHLKDAIKDSIFDIFKKGIQGRLGGAEAGVSAIALNAPQISLNRAAMANVRRLDPVVAADARVRVQPMTGVRLDPKVIDAIKRRPKVVKPGGRQPPIRPRPQPDPHPQPPKIQEKTGTFTRALSFFFDRDLDQHVHIFAAITGGSLESVWQDTEFGAIRPAEFPNTVYMLPHEFRLSYDPLRGLPHMVPVQYKADDDTFRLRVTLRVEPWYDPSKVARLQAALAHQSSGAFLHPTIVPGGVETATMELRTAFPEDVDLIGSDGPVAIDPRAPFDLVLDLSQEFYQLMIGMMTGPVGLNGVVQVPLSTTADDGDDAATQIRTVEMRLNFNALGQLPLEIGAIPAAINPAEATITNNCAQAITINNTEITLLQLDENSVSPINIFGAGREPADPMVIEPGGTVDIAFAPDGAIDDPVWNAVELAITGHDLSLDPEASLRAIHDLADTAAFGWELTVTTFHFRIDQSALPPEQQIMAVEVQMWREDSPDRKVQVTLDAGKDSETITFPRDLNDLVSADAAAEFLSLKTRTRAVYLTGFGEWGPEMDHTGANLIAFAPALTS